MAADVLPLLPGGIGEPGNLRKSAIGAVYPTLRRLSDEGYRIRIITHRLFINFFHEASVRQTIRWLDKHGIPYRDLCFMGEKDQVGADVYVDDSPDNVEALRAAGHFCVCFANSANRNVEAPRARNWEQVYKLIKERHPEPKGARE